MDSSMHSCWFLFIVFIINNGKCDMLETTEQQEIPSMSTDVAQAGGNISEVESNTVPGWWLPLLPEEESNSSTNGNETLVPLIVLSDPPSGVLGNDSNTTDIEGDIVFEEFETTDDSVNGNETDVTLLTEEIMDPEESLISSNLEATNTSSTSYSPPEADVTTMPTSSVSTDIIENSSTPNMTYVTEAPSA